MDFGAYKHIEFRRKFWKLFGAEIAVNDATNQQLIGFIKMKAWQLKEDIRMYRDKSMSQELFGIHARSVIDFGAIYDVIDSTTGQPIFSLRRKGLRSTFVRDYWELFNPAGQQIGYIQETSSTLALIRRYLEAIVEFAGLIFMFVPQTYEININTQDGGKTLVGQITHRKNPFIVKLSLDTTGAQITVDPRIAVAGTTMLAIVDASKG